MNKPAAKALSDFHLARTVTAAVEWREITLLKPEKAENFGVTLEV